MPPSPPPEFPFGRSGRVVHSSRALFWLAAILTVLTSLIGWLGVAYSAVNPAGALVALGVFAVLLLAMIGWCLYWAVRVRRWEREYERATGRRFGSREI